MDVSLQFPVIANVLNFGGKKICVVETIKTRYNRYSENLENWKRNPLDKRVFYSSFPLFVSFRSFLLLFFQTKKGKKKKEKRSRTTFLSNPPDNRETSAKKYFRSSNESLIFHLGYRMAIYEKELIDQLSRRFEYVRVRSSTFEYRSRFHLFSRLANALVRFIVARHPRTYGSWITYLGWTQIRRLVG